MIKPQEAIDLLKNNIKYNEDPSLQDVSKILQEMISKMHMLFEVASGEYHGNEGNEHIEIDEILEDVSKFIGINYTRAFDISDDSEFDQSDD